MYYPYLLCMSLQYFPQICADEIQRRFVQINQGRSAAFNHRQSAGTSYFGHNLWKTGFQTG